MRDLTDASGAAIACERARVSREGIGAAILKLQQADGSFVDKGGIDAMPVLATSFGLYFLGPPAKK